VTRSAGGRRVAAALGAAVLLVAACTSDSSPARPESITGKATTPRQPIIVDPLPEGWRVQDARLGQLEPVSPVHTLYLGPESTPEAGPAIAVGHVHDDGGYVLCGAVSVQGDILRRPGQRVEVVAPVAEGLYDSRGYVFGREVTDGQILAAQAGARPGRDQRLTIAPDKLPANFVEVARVSIPPNALVGEVVTLVNTDGDVVRFGAYDADDAARFFTRFWKATVSDQRCADDSSSQVFRAVGNTHVTVQGDVPPRVVRDIARRLRRTDLTGFGSFQVLEQPQPRALVRECEQRAGHEVLGTTEGPVRWAVSLPTRIEPGAVFCLGYEAGGRTSPGAATPISGTDGGAGSHNVEIFADGDTQGIGVDVQIVGGTVPPETVRVLVERGRGNVREGFLSKELTEDGRRLFTIAIPPPALGPPNQPVTLAAYDPYSREVGRYNAP
jgi:hypothetical protein